jgi:hypothetical protein
MPVVRFEPGAEAPRTGTYALTGEWGEPVGERTSVAIGERLPVVDNAAGPRWFVPVAVDDPPPASLALNARRLGPSASSHSAPFEHTGTALR